MAIKSRPKSNFQMPHSSCSCSHNIYPVNMKQKTTICTLAKRYSNGVSMASRCLPYTCIWCAGWVEITRYIYWPFIVYKPMSFLSETRKMKILLLLVCLPIVFSVPSKRFILDNIATARKSCHFSIVLDRFMYNRKTSTVITFFFQS